MIYDGCDIKEITLYYDYYMALYEKVSTFIKVL